jgi:glycosyltransferase involved in cell wall biosynthesis
LKRVIISVTNDLTTDQRVDKVCTSLLKLDYEVLLIGRKLQNSIPVSRAYKTKRFNLFFNSGFLFYAEYNFRLFFFLLFSKKDILVSNDLDTLTANFLTSKILNKKLVYDSHELFTEVPELINRENVKNVWLKIEGCILPKLKNIYTVNDKIANFYSEKYNIDVQVIKNFPAYKEVEKGGFSFDTNGKKILMYQGAINIGRGLELLIDTLKILDDFLLVIIGDGDISNELKAKVSNESLEESVKFLGRVEPIHLAKLTPLADIGFSIEEDLGLNYRYALPNKIFDYIQAEIPVIVSDLPEMKQIVLDYNVGSFLINRTPENLAKLIQKVIATNYSDELKSAKKILTWQSEEKKLHSIFKNLK